MASYEQRRLIAKRDVKHLVAGGIIGLGMGFIIISAILFSVVEMFVNQFKDFYEDKAGDQTTLQTMIEKIFPQKTGMYNATFALLILGSILMIAGYVAKKKMESSWYKLCDVRK